MKVRDSGMPDEEMWTGFFEPTKMLAVIHWNYDPTTPRGPAMEIGA